MTTKLTANIMIAKLSTKLLLNGVAPATGLLLSLWLIWNVETRFYPVVKDFRIENATLAADGVTLSGTLNVVRNCELVNLTLTKSSNNTPRRVLSSHPVDLFAPGSSLGIHSWGPVTLKLSSTSTNLDDTISVVALHRCHSLWLQKTEYSTFLWGDLRNLQHKQKFGADRTNYYLRIF